MNASSSGLATILLVEDNAAIRGAFRLLLEEHGYRVLDTGSGGEALRLARSDPPDLVLLDLGLPDVPGLEVATQLAATRETMPIVALTGRALETDREACLRAGCTEYLVKPLDSERLLRVLDGQLLKPGAAAD